LNWSPDGRFIVCVYEAEGRDRYQNDIYIIDIRTQKLIRLTNDIATKANPCFSPDGEKIAFLSNKERKDGLMDLYIMDIKGRKRQRLTHLPTPFTFGGIVWITKETICGVKQYRMEDIYIMEKQTGRIRRLTNNVNMPRNIFPNLSPDGEKIVFNSFVDGNWEIYVMDINGRNLKRLIHNPADDFSPCWTPDNKEIIFWSSRKPPGLYIMDESGRNIRRLPIPSTMTPTSHSCSPVLKNLQ
jgi:Tol biopolymer transport system component